MNWIQRNFKKIVYVAFLVPILAVAGVSISHVTTWYSLSNPLSWAIYLSVGIEIAALSALAAISAKMGKKVYFPFGIVTLIQFIGNIFFAYQYINVDSQPFKDWVDLVDPLVSYLGVDSGDMIGHKRFLALFSGGMLPIISLSFLHMLVKFEEDEKQTNTSEVSKPDINIDELSIEAGKKELEIEKELEQEKFNPTQEQLEMLEKIIMGKYKGPEEIKVKEPPINPTEEDLIKLEAELIRVNEEKFGSLVEQPMEETTQNPETKRLNYTKRNDSHTKIQSI
jgi:hypothetical protein